MSFFLREVEDFLFYEIIFVSQTFYGIFIYARHDIINPKNKETKQFMPKAINNFI